jgi:hypothetical protein
MDRRQVLFGMTALGLASNFNLNRLANAQIGKAAAGNGRLSDRERAGLHGLVKTCSDFMGDEAESMCDAEYSTDGRLLVWRGRISDGSRAERVYSYNGTGALIGVAGGGADGTAKFHYDEHGRKTLVRTVPPRPDRQGSALGVGAMFEVTEEDGWLVGGGTVTTHYNENDQPLKTLVRGAHGELLTRIDHTYDAQGRLVGDTLVRESFEFPEFMIPEQYREQFYEEQRQATLAQMRELLSQHEGFLKGAERSYVYDDQNRVIKRELRMGSWCQSITTTYNEHGDDASVVTIQRGSPDPKVDLGDQRSEVSYLYQYDSHGNWIQQTTVNSLNPDEPYVHHRKLTYY